MLESTRRQEAAVKRDTIEQLDAFRKHQEEAERKALAEQNAGSPPTDDAQWVPGGRKRKKGNEKDRGLLKGVKLRKASSRADTGVAAKTTAAQEEVRYEDEPSSSAAVKQDAKKGVDAPSKTTQSSTTTKSPSPTAPTSNIVSLGLGYASSDDDD